MIDSTLVTHHGSRITDYPKVSIIILNWNGWEDTIECLESIYRITYPNYEVIVVDNGSEDESIKKVKEYCEGKIEVDSKFFEYSSENKPIKIVEYRREEAEAGGGKEKEIENLPSNRKLILIKNEKNYGFAEGNNIAIRYALKALNLNPDYVLLLNNDTVVDKEFLGELVKVGEGDEKVGIVGTVVFSYYEPKNMQFFGWERSSLTGKAINKFKGKDKESIKGLLNADYISGCVMLVKSNVLKNVGLLDPIYFLYHEDADFCQRVRNNNYKLIAVPTSYVYHKHSATASKVREVWFYYGVRNRFIFQKRYATKMQFLCFFIYIFIYEVPYTIATCLFYHRNLHFLNVFFKGLKQGLMNK